MDSALRYKGSEDISKLDTTNIRTGDVFYNIVDEHAYIWAGEWVMIDTVDDLSEEQEPTLIEIQPKTRICKQCGAPAKLGNQSCEYCGTLF